MFIATCTERELRKRKKRKFSLWVRQCSSTGFIIQVSPGLARAEGEAGALAHWVISEPLTYLFPVRHPNVPAKAGAGLLSSTPGHWGWPALSPACSSHSVSPSG